MYRVVKSKSPESYAVHKVIKTENGEVFIEADALLKGNSLDELNVLARKLHIALDKAPLNKGEVILVHKTLWNENDIPFYEDIAEELLEEEFMDEATYNDDDKAHSRW